MNHDIVVSWDIAAHRSVLLRTSFSPTDRSSLSTATDPKLLSYNVVALVLLYTSALTSLINSLVKYTLIYRYICIRVCAPRFGVP